MRQRLRIARFGQCPTPPIDRCVRQRLVAAYWTGGFHLRIRARHRADSAMPRWSQPPRRDQVDVAALLSRPPRSDSDLSGEHSHCGSGFDNQSWRPENPVCNPVRKLPVRASGITTYGLSNGGPTRGRSSSLRGSVPVIGRYRSLDLCADRTIGRSHPVDRTERHGCDVYTAQS